MARRAPLWGIAKEKNAKQIGKLFSPQSSFASHFVLSVAFFFGLFSIPQSLYILVSM